MESTQSLKRRIKSVANTSQITKAMELVAATKMRRSQEIALASRPYAYAALEILATVSRIKEFDPPEILVDRPVKKTAFLIVTSDKGLAGSFNSAVIRTFERFMKAEKINPADPACVFITIGQKAEQYLENRNLKVWRSFVRTSDFTTVEETEPIAEALINEGYLNRVFDRVIVFSTIFITALRQDVMVRTLLPIKFDAIKESAAELIPKVGRYAEYIDQESFSPDIPADYLIEPSPARVLEELAPELFRIRLYHLLMEANASEHSARRVAMKNASDNASDLSRKLRVEYNKLRQDSITRDIIEITSYASNT